MKDNKTLGIYIRFWTNDLEVRRNGKDNVSCWDSGVMKLESSESKGIKDKSPTNFGCLEDIVPLIKKLCKENRILMVSSCRKQKSK